MCQLDVGKLFRMKRGDFLAPQHAGVQHIGLVHRTDLSSSRARQLESCARDATNLAGGVLLGIEAAALPISKGLDAARLSEIDAAGELADDDEVDAFQHPRLEW